MVRQRQYGQLNRDDNQTNSKTTISKLALQNIYGKHRYIYFNANKNDKKKFLNAFKLNKESYPKEKNQRYENNTDIGGQMLLI